MNNTDKLLRAFIDALGYEIEEVNLARTRVPKGTDIDTAQVIRISGDGLYYTGGIDYKVTKKDVGSIPVDVRIIKEAIDILGLLSTSGDRNIAYVDNIISDLEGVLSPN